MKQWLASWSHRWLLYQHQVTYTCDFHLDITELSKRNPITVLQLTSLPLEILMHSIPIECHTLWYCVSLKFSKISYFLLYFFLNFLFVQDIADQSESSLSSKKSYLSFSWLAIADDDNDDTAIKFSCGWGLNSQSKSLLSINFKNWHKVFHYLSRIKEKNS